MDIGLAFLHDGLPKKHLKSVFVKKTNPEPDAPCPARLDEALLAVMKRKNCCSTEFITIQYDHTVQGGHVLGPVQGRGRVQSVATLTKIVPGSKKAVGLSQALFPSYSEIDPYNMAGAGIDTALRGLVAMGIPPGAIAILDNFCWCSSDEPKRLGQLKLAALGCYDFAKAFGTPFISGKDSMFNDFSGFDAEGKQVLVSVPPTLLISSIGVHPDAEKAVSMDAKIAGDLVYVIGGTREELGGSEYFAHLGSVGNTVPVLDAAAAKERYIRLANAIAHELVASAFPVSHGGLGVALAKVAVAGRLGMDLTVPVPDTIRPDFFLFSESLSRFVVTVDKDHKRAFEQVLGPDAVLLGRTGGSRLRITARTLLLDVAVADLEKAYKAPFGRY
jgi:phosphoribosylformylglycinamidine synthase